MGVVVPAAGAGRRMGGSRKQYLALNGEPILLRALAPFLRRADVGMVVVALPPEDAVRPPTWLLEADSGVDGGAGGGAASGADSRPSSRRGSRIHVVAGGASRGESVRAGIEALSSDATIVAIHDGARPLVDDDIVDRCIRIAREGVGAVAACPAVDTMKVVDENLRILRTPDRDRLWHAQTPQVFPREMILEAYRAASSEELAATDDAALVESRGGNVRVVRGAFRNLKVTREDDLTIAASYLKAESREDDR